MAEDFENSRKLLFYGRPKIHKIFDSFPPQRFIVSEFVDSFLKFQAQKRKYYIRGTKDFKLLSTKNIPENSFLVTMDVSSLYTNIHHEEGAEACFKKLEERKNKSVPSIVIKNLILMIFNSNPFRFSNEYCSQIIGTAMGHK